MSKFFDKYFKVKTNEDKFKIEPVWKKIEKIPEFAVLKTCKQSPKWHSEGDAFKHTQCVINAAIEDIQGSYSYVSETVKALVLAALFHDIGKGVTTFEKDGKWHAYGHEIEGEKITRKLLWDEGWAFRESVCALVRLHMEPLNWFNMKGGILEKLAETQELISKVAYADGIAHMHITDLIRLKMWDIKGSKQEDEKSKSKDLENLSKLYQLCSEIFNYKTDGLYDFILHKKFKMEEKKPLTVVTLIGLPGAGKDTFLSKLLQTDSPFTYVYDGVLKTVPTYDPKKSVVLCRDDIRAELGFCSNGEKIVGTSKQEQEVTKLFNERLLDAAREGKVIVLNNINLKAKYREETLRYLYEYDVHSIYYYIEADCLDKNKERREGQIPDEVFDNMIMNFDWPKPSEYNEFYKITT